MAGQEIELKFNLDAATFARLRRSKYLKGLSAEPPRVRHLIATYYDTRDGRLGAAGIAWRLRREGGEIVQTIKSLNGDGVSRREMEAPIRGALPDLDQVPDAEFAQALRDKLNGCGVEPKATTDVRRTERLLKIAGGGVVEAALDAADLSNGSAHEMAHELELELKEGEPSALFEIAQPLLEDYPLEISLVAKVERALHAGEPRKSFKAPHLVLPQAATARDALAAVLTQTARHLTHHAQIARAHDDPEAIHQIRVCLRRQRAALNAFGRYFKSDRLNALAERARDLANTLSEARDLDVFEEEILKPAREAVADPGALAALTAAVADRRLAGWERARQALNSAQYRLYLLAVVEVSLLGFPLGEGSPDPQTLSAQEVGSDILDRRLKRVQSLADRFAELSIIERHDLRKELKKLRYPSEMFASLYDKGVRKYFESLAKLQDDLGSLNDVATARSLLRELVAAIAAKDEGRGIEAAFAAGEIAGWHMRESEKSIRRVAKHWAAFAAIKPFWRR